MATLKLKDINKAFISLMVLQAAIFDFPIYKLKTKNLLFLLDPSGCKSLTTLKNDCRIRRNLHQVNYTH